MAGLGIFKSYPVEIIFEGNQLNIKYSRGETKAISYAAIKYIEFELWIPGTTGGKRFFPAFYFYDKGRYAEGRKLICKAEVPDKESYFLIAEQLKLMIKQFHQRLMRIGFNFTMEELSSSLRTPFDVKQEKETIVLPKTVSLSGIGRFTYDEEVELYRKNKEGLTLSISGSDGKEIRDAKKQMAMFWDSRTQCINRAKQYCVGELLSLKNESWLSDGENSVSEEEFVKKLKLQEVIASMDEITLYFSDGDLFWGHYIEVEMDEDGNLFGQKLLDRF